MRRGVVLFVAAATAVCLARVAAGDEVVTYSGKTYTGAIVREDNETVIIKTEEGVVEIPRKTVRSMEKGPEKPAKKLPPIVPKPIEPEKADEAFKEAKAGVGWGMWRDAAATLEGLLLLDEKAFGDEDRLSAAGALVTCYIEMKDAHGAARSFSRRAMLVGDAKVRQRLLATAEALRETGHLKILGKTIKDYDSAVEAAMPWKAEQILGETRDIIKRSKFLERAERLERAALAAQDKLEEADRYVPGFSAKQRKAVIGDLLETVMEGARDAVRVCTEEREALTRTRTSSVASKRHALAWNQKASVYMARRQAAEEALGNLKPFAEKFEVTDLLDEAACEELLAKLDDLQYYPDQHMKIQLRKFSWR